MSGNIHGHDSTVAANHPDDERRLTSTESHSAEKENIKRQQRNSAGLLAWLLYLDFQFMDYVDSVDLLTLWTLWITWFL
jgi:hypothetical protein